MFKRQWGQAKKMGGPLDAEMIPLGRPSIVTLHRQLFFYTVIPFRVETDTMRQKQGKMDLLPAERTIPTHDVSWGVFCCVSALPRGAYTSTAHGAVCVCVAGGFVRARCSLAPRWTLPSGALINIIFA